MIKAILSTLGEYLIVLIAASFLIWLLCCTFETYSAVTCHLRWANLGLGAVHGGDKCLVEIKPSVWVVEDDVQNSYLYYRYNVLTIKDKK